MQRFSLIQHTLKSQTQPFEPGCQMLAHTRWWLFGGSASPPPPPQGFLSISLGLALASQRGTLSFHPDEQGMACTGTYCTRKHEEWAHSKELQTFQQVQIYVLNGSELLGYYLYKSPQNSTCYLCLLWIAIRALQCVSTLTLEFLERNQLVESEKAHFCVP